MHANAIYINIDFTVSQSKFVNYYNAIRCTASLVKKNSCYFKDFDKEISKLTGSL